jgi:hypothetical protein
MAGSASYPLPAAIRAVRAGMSARAGLRSFRAEGGAVTDATWFRVVGEVRRTLANNLDEASRPLNRRPLGAEITTMTTRRQTGYWQQVEVFTRDRITGEVKSSPFVVRSPGLLTRQAAIRAALDEYHAGAAGSVNPDEEDVLGAAYTSTMELSPGPVADTFVGGGGAELSPVQAAIRGAYDHLRGRTDLPRGNLVGNPEMGMPMTSLHDAFREDGWVFLSDLRAEMGATYDRATLDSALRDLATKVPGVYVIPVAARHALLNRDLDAQVTLGGEELHLIRFGGLP